MFVMIKFPTCFLSTVLYSLLNNQNGTYKLHYKSLKQVNILKKLKTSVTLFILLM